MSQQVAERAPSFEERATGRVRVSTWDQPDYFPEIASTGFVSPRHEPKQPPTNGQRCGKMKWFSETKGYGFTECSVYVNIRNVIGRGLRTGARIKFDVIETPKGLSATNVRVIG
ncbi:cold shock domain-containing protein [Brevibacillus borstelensis]|uniref:cold-shock protein n=1 Tax=Brevibacillus borstelensis TaxID=45462 RepID=UPI002E1A81F8|nr:cold shock domain-containing protein [Brevibacillus borstelensis]